MEGDPSQESLKAVLFDLLKKRDLTCADCGVANPDWASVSLGIFICVECSGIHRQMGTHISRVKSVRLDNWKQAEVEDMKRVGNEGSNKIFLARLEPLRPFYAFPRLPEDGASMREQWIRCKYERREWVAGGLSPCLQQRVLQQLSVPVLEDWVVKRGAKRKNWKKRWCVVIGTSIAYYARKQDTQPKGTLSLLDVGDIHVYRPEGSTTSTSTSSSLGSSSSSSSSSSSGGLVGYMEGHHHVLKLDCQPRGGFFLSLETGESSSGASKLLSRPGGDDHAPSSSGPEGELGAQRLLDWATVLRCLRLRLVEGRGGQRRAAQHSAVELLTRAMQELSLRPRKHGKQVFNATFLGSQLVDWLMVVEELTSREDAVAVANEMMRLKRLKHVQNESTTIIDGLEPYVWI